MSSPSAFDAAAESVLATGGKPDVFVVGVEAGVRLRMRATGETREQAEAWARQWTVRDENGTYLVLKREPKP